MEAVLVNVLPLYSSSPQEHSSLTSPPDLVAENQEGEDEFTKVGLKGTWEAISENSCP